MTGREVTLPPWERNPELLWEVESLAPEMAEAILAWSDGQHGDREAHSDSLHAMHALTAKLRAIGGDRG